MKGIGTWGNAKQTKIDIVSICTYPIQSANKNSENRTSSLPCHVPQAYGIHLKGGMLFG